MRRSRTGLDLTSTGTPPGAPTSAPPTAMQGWGDGEHPRGRHPTRDRYPSSPVEGRYQGHRGLDELGGGCAGPGSFWPRCARCLPCRGSRAGPKHERLPGRTRSYDRRDSDAVRAFALVITLVVACFVFAAITGFPVEALAVVFAIPF